MTQQEPTYVHPGASGPAKSVLLGLVILAAGVAIGAGAMFLHLSRQPNRPDREPERFTEIMLHRLSDELNLTDAQRRTLEPIIRTHHRTLSDIRAQVRPQIVEQLEQLDEAILDVLDDQQAQLWQDRARQLEQHFPTFRGRRGDGSGRGEGPGRRQPGMGPGRGEGFEGRRQPGTGPGRQYRHNGPPPPDEEPDRPDDSEPPKASDLPEAQTPPLPDES